MASALLPILTQVGAPILKQILAGKIGQGNAELVNEVLYRIAGQVGVEPDDLDMVARTSPEDLHKAVAAVEAEAPELIALYTRELEIKAATFEAEAQNGGWVANWRPGWMYLLGFLWLWQVVLLHAFNAAFKIALPPAPWSVLLQLTAIFLGLYMGGHTVKDFVSKKWGAGA